MARYIEVYALMNYATNQKDKTIDANDIARFPWADVVEVVRCRECVHGKLGCPNDIVCDYWDSDGLDSNDFCSYGERRTDDDRNG